MRQKTAANRGVGAAGWATGGATGFFRRSLACSQGTTTEQRCEFRQRIYTTIQAIGAQGKASIEQMCQLGDVSRAGFYRDWQQQEPAEAETEIRDQIQKEALKHRRFGYRRIAVLLKRQGVAVGEGVIRRILRSDNLLAVRGCSSVR